MTTASEQALWGEYLSTIDARLERFRSDADAKLRSLERAMEGAKGALAAHRIARIQALGPIAAELDALLEKIEWLSRERHDLNLLLTTSRRLATG